MMYSKKITIPVLVVGLLLAAIGLALPMLRALDADVIGGAGWPAYKYLLTSRGSDMPWLLIYSGIAVFLVGLYGLILGKPLARHSSPKLTLLSLGSSVVIAGGAVCFLEFVMVSAFSNKIYQYPIAGPVSALGSFLTFAGVVVLLAFYCKYRKSKMSVKGILLDILLVVLPIAPLFLAALYFSNLVGRLT